MSTDSLIGLLQPIAECDWHGKWRIQKALAIIREHEADMGEPSSNPEGTASNGEVAYLSPANTSELWGGSMLPNEKFISKSELQASEIPAHLSLHIAIKVSKIISSDSSGAKKIDDIMQLITPFITTREPVSSEQNTAEQAGGSGEGSKPNEPRLVGASASPDTEQPDDCRKAFEKWCGAECDLTPRPHDGYVDTYTDDLWDGWQSGWNARQPERESICRDALRLIMLKDWGWKGGGSDVRILGNHGRIAAKALKLSAELPLGWPSDEERAELAELSKQIEDQPTEPGGER